MKSQKSCENFVISVYKTLEMNPSKLKNFINLFTKRKTQSNTAQIHKNLIDILKDHAPLIDQLNKLVPEQMRVPILSSENEEYDDEAVGNIIAQLQQRKPGIVNNLIGLLTEMKQDKTQNALLLNRLNELLQDEPEIFEYFRYKLDQDNKIKRQSETEYFPDQQSNTQVSDPEKPVSRMPKNRPRLIRNERSKNPEPDPVPVSHYIPPTPVNMPAPPIKNEISFFEVLVNELPREKYIDTIKLIALYTECIISAQELFLMTKDIIGSNEHHFSYFQDLIMSREASRRKASTFYKPLCEIDFKSFGCERCISYIRVPEKYPFFRNPANKHIIITREVLNTTWVSVPHGSEHESSFTVMRKNPYEEALFKCEEERYELDNNIQIHTKAIQLLESIIEKPTPFEKLENLIEKLYKLKGIQKNYLNNPEILESLKRNPRGTATALLEKLQTKLKDLKETKINSAKKNWRETSEKNFHRSLDHRSFIFKQNEKKYTNPKTDAQNRCKMLSNAKFNDNTVKFWDILNTFEGILSDISLKKIKGNQKLLYSQIYHETNVPHCNKQKFPIYHINISDQKINQDLYDILCLAIQYAHINNAEKIKKILRSFLSDLLKLPLKNPQNFERVIPESQIFAIVSRIKSNIYDKSYNSIGQNALGYKNDIKEENKINDDGFSIPIFSNAIPKATSVDDLESETSNGLSINNMDKNKKNSISRTKFGKESVEFDDLDLMGSEYEDDKEKFKEMEYIHNLKNTEALFLPEKNSHSILFYGTQNVYFFVRFYFTLYERLQNAFFVSRTFPQNPNTDLLTEEQKEKLSTERYEIFKWILIHLLRQNFDSTKFEDFTRCIFGNDAYLMFHMDKIISYTIKTIQNLATDDISIKSINCFSKNSGTIKGDGCFKHSHSARFWNEEVYLARLNYLILHNLHLLQSTTFFRFNYDLQKYSVFINLYETPYKDWVNTLVPNILNYIENYITIPISLNSGINSQNIVFLRRNKEKIKRKQDLKNKLIQYNNIEFKSIPNSCKLIADTIGKEDILISKNRYNKRSIMSEIINELNRVKKFKDWHQITQHTMK